MGFAGELRACQPATVPQAFRRRGRALLLAQSPWECLLCRHRYAALGWGAMLPDRLTLKPIARFQGTLELPGSKSLSNRVLLLSALAEGETEVTRVLDSEDTDVMLSALRSLGVRVRGLPGSRDSLWIVGKGGAL